MIQEEFEWAQHLSLPAVIFPLPTATSATGSRNLMLLGNVIARLLQKTMNTAIWIRVPSFTSSVTITNSIQVDSDAVNSNSSIAPDAFEQWHQLRSLCGMHNNLQASML